MDEEQRADVDNTQSHENWLCELAMKATTKDEADLVLMNYTLRLQTKWKKTPEEASRIAKENIGYYAGYFSNETRERVERLFDCAHPFFGKISEKGPPTAEEAFRLGQEWGERIRKERENRG